MRTRTTRLAAALIGTALVGAGLAACSSSAPGPASSTAAAPERNAALEALITKAKSEGALTLTWAVYPDAVNTKLIEAFKKEYGIDFPVRIGFESNIDSLTSKLQEEATAGVKSSSDLVLSTSANAGQVLSSKAKGLVVAQDWASFSPWNKDLAEAGGEFLAIGTQFPGFIYNTDKLKKADVPTSAAQIEALSQKYHIASTPYASAFDTLAFSLGSTDAVLKHVQNFKASGLIACGEVSRVATGEFDAMWVGCGKSKVDEEAAKGAPVTFVSMKELPVVNPVYVAVPKNSEHPAAAALFGAWLNTPAAQKITWDGTKIDNAQIPGTNSYKYAEEMKKSGITPIFNSVDFVVQNPTIFDRTFKGKLVAALTKK